MPYAAFSRDVAVSFAQQLQDNHQVFVENTGLYLNARFAYLPYTFDKNSKKNQQDVLTGES